MRTVELEALLFAHGAPMERSELCLHLQATEMELAECLAELEKTLVDRAVQVRYLGAEVALEVKPEFQDLLHRAAGEQRQNLSPSTLETLAVIAYCQPVTRMTVEEMRGVRMGRSLTALLEQDLIEVCGHEQGPGQPKLYRTTIEFLRRFGLSSLMDLPTSPLGHGHLGLDAASTTPL